MVGASRPGFSLTSSSTARAGGSSRIFEHRVGRIAVHRIGAVQNHDAPSALGGGEAQKPGDGARVGDDDLASQPPAARIIAALDHQEVGMPTRGDAAEDRMVRRHGKTRGRRRGEQPLPHALARGEKKAREAECQRRLADAARPGEQPGMRQPSRAIGGDERRLGCLMTDQIRILARRQDRHLHPAPVPPRRGRRQFVTHADQTLEDAPGTDQSGRAPLRLYIAALSMTGLV